MRKIVSLALVTLALPSLAIAQQTSSQWSVRFTGTAGPVASMTRQTANGMWAAIPYGDRRCFALVEASGEVVPQLCFDGEVPHNVAAAADGGFFVWGGHGFTPNVPPPAWIARFDRSRRVLWARRIDAGHNLLPNVAAGTSDGGIILGGGFGDLGPHPCEKCQSSFVLKMSATGSVEWLHVFNVPNYEDITAIVPMSGGYIVAGATEPGAWLAKLDANGQVIWRRWFSSTDEIAAAVLLPNGDVMAVGTAHPGLYWIAKVTSAGEVRWQKAAKRVNPAALHNVVLRRDGTLAAYGLETVDRLWALTLVTFNVDGEVLWQRQVRLGKEMYASEMELAADDGIIVSLWTQKYAELDKFAVDGQPPSCLAAATLATDLKFEPLSSKLISPAVEEPRASATAVDDPVTPLPVDIPTGSCEPLGRPAAVAQAPPVPPEEQKYVELSQRIDAAEREFAQRVVELLAAHKFAELDRLGNEVRESGATFADALPRLYTYYQATSTQAPAYGTSQQHLQLLKDWRQAMPASVSATVAQARAYYNYAFEARGSGGASGVTSEGWQSFESLRDTAAKIVANAQAGAAKDPSFQMLRVQIAGTSCDNIDAVAHDPRLRQFTYPQLWRTAALFFLPRWCGSPDQSRKFAEYAADSTKKSLGQSLYALIAWDTVAQEGGDRQVLSAYRFDWPRIRQGFLDLLARYPDALLMYQRFAYLAQFFEDRATARTIFAKPQAVWSTAAEAVWRGREQYDVARRWADTQTAQTFVNAPEARQSHGAGVAAGDGSTSWITGAAAKWPPLFLINDVTTSDGLHFLFNSFLVRSNNGIVGITALTKFGKQQTFTSGSGKQAIFVNAVKLPLFRTHLEKWTTYQPGKPSVMISPSAFESNATSEALHGIVLKFDSSTKLPSVRILMPYRPTGDSMSLRRVYVVACRPGVAPCTQTAFAGEIKSGGESGGQRGFTILLDEPVPWGDLIGSPVINDSGEVLAVVAAPSEPVMRAADNAVFIHAEDVNSVLARAGLTR